MKIKVYVKRPGFTTFVEVKAIYPFKCLDIFDERLDEGTITIYTKDENYEPLTVVKIEVKYDPPTGAEKTKTHFFHISSDNATELVGVKVTYGYTEHQAYRHDLGLIELTKELEGIACQTITFTNPKKRGSLPQVEVAPTYYGDDLGMFSTGITSPVTDDSFTCKSVWEIIGSRDKTDGLYRRIIQKFNDDHPGHGFTTIDQITNTNLEFGGNTVTDPNETITVSNLGSINEMRYRFTAVGYEDGGTTVARAYIDFSVLFAHVDVMPTEHVTVAYCIQRCLDLAIPLYGNDTPKYILDNEDETYYNKIVAPEFTIQESNLREQLQTIGKYIHAEPWLDDENKIHFQDYGVTDEEEIFANYGGRVLKKVTRNIDEFCTEVKTYAKNVVSDANKIVDPAPYTANAPSDIAGYRSLRSEEVNARIGSGNGFASTSAPIYKIETVKCGIYYGGEWKVAPKDITDFVFEETVYNSQLSSYSGSYQSSKQYAIYYKIGEKGIKGLFYKTPKIVSQALSAYSISNILSSVSSETVVRIDNLLLGHEAELVFQITYVPISNFSVVQQKKPNIANFFRYKFTKQLNQAEGIADARAFGENMKGTAERIGNVEQERTYYFYNPDYIPEAGKMLDGYAISAVTSEYMPSYVKSTVSLTKDFNRISQYIGIRSNRRLYEVSERNVYDRHALLECGIVFGVDAQYSIDENVAPTYLFLDSVVNVLKGEAGSLTRSCIITTKEKDGTPIAKVQSPVIASAIGNNNIFTVEMKDNYSAGVAAKYVSSGNTDIIGYWAQDVPYSNYYGKAYYADLAFRAESDANSSPFAIPSVTETPGVASTINVYDYVLRKDNREKISISTEIEYVSIVEHLFVGSELPRRIISPTAMPTVLYGIVEDFGMTKFDEHIEDIAGLVESGVLQEISGLTITAYSGNIAFARKNAPQNLLGWVIVTEQTVTTETVTDGDGNIKTVDKEVGGDILLMSLKPCNIGADIFGGLKASVKQYK